MMINMIYGGINMSEVCQCPDEDNTIDICVGQYKAAMRETDKWFAILRKHCGHNKNDINCNAGKKGFCVRNTCPILKGEK